MIGMSRRWPQLAGTKGHGVERDVDRAWNVAGGELGRRSHVENHRGLTGRDPIEQLGWLDVRHHRPRRAARILTNDRPCNSSLVSPVSRASSSVSAPRAQAAHEEVEQPLPRRRIVEHVADERRLGGLLDEVAQPGRGGRARGQKERVDRGVARRQLRRMQIPSLVETVHQRMPHIVEMQSSTHDGRRRGSRGARRPSATRRRPARCGAMGMMLVAPSESQTPVCASATCIMCFAKSHAA